MQKLSCLINFHTASLCNTEEVCLRNIVVAIDGLCSYGLGPLLREVDVRCWGWQQDLQPLPHPLAMIKASPDMGQLCNLGSGWCEEKKSCERACWGLSPFVQESHLISVACCACTWLCALLTLTLPWLPGLTWDLLHHCKLVWWVQDCGWLRLMPPDLLCLHRDCVTVALACEVLACLAAPLAPSSPPWAEVLLLPGMFLFMCVWKVVLLFFFFLPLLRINWCPFGLSVHENGKFALEDGFVEICEYERNYSGEVLIWP